MKLGDFLIATLSFGFWSGELWFSVTPSAWNGLWGLAVVLPSTVLGAWALGKLGQRA